jgi:hypothetical protein
LRLHPLLASSLQGVRPERQTAGRTKGQGMTSTYFLEIDNRGQSKIEAFAYGDFAEVNFIARRRIAAMTGSTEDYAVTLVEVESDKVGALDGDNQPFDGTVKRTVTAFQGDGDTAAVVLKRKLAAERKEQEQGQETSGQSETEGVPQGV